MSKVFTAQIYFLSQVTSRGSAVNVYEMKTRSFERTNGIN